MKILIVDNPDKDRGFSTELKNHAEIIIQNKNLEAIDFSQCKLIFKHDSFNADLDSKLKSRIAFIEFSGGGALKNEIFNESDGFKFKACIESPEQINSVLSVIDKSEISKEDLEAILNYDSELEKLLTPFQAVLPLDSEWKKHKTETKEDLWQKRTDLRNHLNK